MELGKRVLIMGIGGLLVAGGLGAFRSKGGAAEAAARPAGATVPAHRPAAPVKPLPVAVVPPPDAATFTPTQLRTFIADAAKADAIADPLKRCMAYPDPPGSHWSPETVKAYCLYHLQSTLSFDQAQELIRTGHAAELDRRLGEALQAQLTRPESAGLLDRTYFDAFNKGSFDVRRTLDAWKRASPKSAFAFAASGFAYVAMAGDARGDAFIQDTPQSNIDAMERLLRLADADLRRAVALDPRVTPSYVAMIKAGSLALGDDYAIKAANLGLTAAPADYAIYGSLSLAAEPEWGGSLKAMRVIARMAQAHVKENPLLAILKSNEPLVAYDACDCEGKASWRAFPIVFADVGSAEELFDAGNAANENGHYGLAVVYLSEGLRFLPDSSLSRQRRDLALSDLGEMAAAVDDATHWIQKSPDDPHAYNARGYAYKAQDNEPNAAADLQHAVTLDPGDMFPLGQLAQMYLNHAEWLKALGVADQMVRAHPELPDGWVVRAMAQRAANRPGLEDTARYFLAHFADTPGQQRYAAMMRAMLAEQAALKRTGTGSRATGGAVH